MAVLEINDLVVDFETDQGIVQAIDHLTLSVREGEIVGLVGESGCGKTTVARCILGVAPQPPARIRAGKILFQGQDLLRVSEADLTTRIRGKAITFIPQDPLAALNPLFPVGVQLRDMLKWGMRRGRRAREIRAHIISILQQVQIPSPAEQLRKYPHEFSGGQRQRIAVARALSINPEFVIADEPVSALDVSIRAQVLNLLQRLQQQFNLTYLFVSHDLSVVRHVADRIAVMYLGKIVELADRDELYAAPKHPYTKALLSAVPIPDPQIEKHRHRIILTGDLPSPINLPTGCRFHTRCPMAQDICREVEPAFEAKEGQELGVQATTAAIGSKLDPVLQLLDNAARMDGKSFGPDRQIYPLPMRLVEINDCRHWKKGHLRPSKYDRAL